MNDQPNRFFLVIIFFYLMLNISASGQVYISYPLQKNANLQSDFYKQSTTWNWLERFNYAGTIDTTWYWQVRETFQSNLIVPAHGKKQWKDENNFVGNFYYRTGSFLSGIYSKSWMQSDEQVSSDNKFAKHTLGLFTVFDYNKTVQITPYAGYQQSKNRSKVDWGWDLGIKGEVKNYRLGNYNTNLGVESNYDFYDQRQNYENRFDIGLSTRFNPYTSDSLSFYFSEVSKEYYVADSIEQAKIYHRELKNKLYYNFSPRDLITLSTRIQSSDLSYLTDRNIFRLVNHLQFQHIGNRFCYGLSLHTKDKTLDNTRTITDSRTRETAMGIQMDYKFSSTKHFNIDFAYVKKQYDTPDEDNNDDRDEQCFIINLNYYHRFSPLLSMNWLAYAYFFHQIYIFKEKSINNRWNREYKLNPRINYRSDRVVNTLSTQVLANYTVYDFEDRFTQASSFVFRKYTFSDSLACRFFSENYLGFFTRIELKEIGSFFEDDFAQQILQSYRTQFYNIFIYNNYFFHFRIKVGYSIYTRREWRHVPVKRQYREITNKGPYVSVVYLKSRRLVFSAHAALSTLTDSRTKTTTYITGHLRLHYNI